MILVLGPCFSRIMSVEEVVAPAERVGLQSFAGIYTAVQWIVNTKSVLARGWAALQSLAV